MQSRFRLNPTPTFRGTVCKECGEKAVYRIPDLEASKGLEFYVPAYYCNYHGPLPMLPMLPQRPTYNTLFGNDEEKC